LTGRLTAGLINGWVAALTSRRRKACSILWLLAFAAALGPASSRADTVASLLGNFTINQYCGLRLGRHASSLRYVVVFGQLPALRELHAADANGDGVTTQAERDAYVEKLAPGFADGLTLTIDGVRVPLLAARWTSSLPVEQGGFSLRVEVEFSAPARTLADGSPHAVELRNDNYSGRMGWHEIVVEPATDLSAFDTNAFDSSVTGALTQALQNLPATGPLDERAVHLTVSAGPSPAGARLLGARAGGSATESILPASGTPGADGRPGTAAPGSATGPGFESGWVESKTRDLVRSIARATLAPGVVAVALLGAVLLGAVHALSPGHGKTIVGAYLIGSRGTPRHAVFLGLTVTLTHTAGVFILGFATLYASRFIVPERLLPMLSLISALLVLILGGVLLYQRIRFALARPLVFHAVAAGAAPRGSALLAAREFRPLDATMHSHGGAMHTHLPPGAAGEKITWRGLLALGVSGGLVPCPSAMVILLAAVALNKTVFGMVLVIAFSVGLAIALTLVGLAFLYARNRFRGRRTGSGSRWPTLVPVASAAMMVLLGALLCVTAIRSFG
jgi:ABC-type nickel/cobalt efflux system permease component RcnA